MYEAHWGLRESPFRAALDPRYFYESPSHDEALSRMLFLIENGRRLGLVLGESGAGKSLLLEVLAARGRRASWETATVRMLGLSPELFLEQLADVLGLGLPAGASTQQVWRSLGDRFVEQRYRQTPLAILLDDIDLAPESTQLQLVRMLSLDPSPDAAITWVLTAQSTAAERWNTRLLDQVDLWSELETWEVDDTQAYLDTAVSKAGRATSAFDAQAAARLHELSGGAPRKIARLAELALVAGASLQLAQVDLHTVESAYEELAAL
ncbi:ExeA family protein [Lignipirellula cremea]|uniref:ORC1/DEAH AAA+ ATPase domain-containing protein n=1 Tax=Lignipirellula cremea TaxID=2528010 RepID=A0A518E3J2_9BACT|nr:AAA family ATPase [Lignipirellula cremea]QDU98660.1 hypothetical protein Pla8534_65320 [Lignipirellula cremea]